MTATMTLPRHASPWLQIARGIAAMFLMLVLSWISAPAHAAMPNAGQSISNQASATYSDGSGLSRTVLSNQVVTTVTQVYSVKLDSPGAQTATPGSIVYYPHTLTNTGNGNDAFVLSAANATGFSMTGVQIFADNGSGQPTGAAITAATPVPLAANGVFKFIVMATVPATATATQTNTLTVTATSGAPSSPPSASNTDTTTVTTNAVLTLNKSISAASGKADGTTKYTYTLTYTNTGNSTATTVSITDQIPAGMTYVTGSATTTPAALTASYAAGTLTASIASVAAGQTGQVTFQVTVDTTTPPGVLPNVASVNYTNAPSGGSNVTASSNVVNFQVLQSAGVTLVGSTVASANAGDTVSFTNRVTNTGNGTDTFNITLGTGNFPAGTTFQLFKSDGVTPLVDNNNDGIPDTGQVSATAPNNFYNVIVKATLPPSASGGSFSIPVTATSGVDNKPQATDTDKLTTITPAKVDLANTSAATGAGVGYYPTGEGAAQNTPIPAINPGTTTTIVLVAKNTGPQPDSYNLAVATDSAMSQSLPSGWTVTFKADGGSGSACTTTGATVTNTGTIVAGGSGTFCAVVGVPAGYSPGQVELYFRAQSPTSSVADVVHDAVTVNAVRALSLAPNGTGQTYPGGSYMYTHTLTNNGNVDEGGVASTINLALSDSGTGWTSTIYLDTNRDGVFNAGDTLVTGPLPAAATLAKGGGTITLFVKVIAPSGAAAGTIDTTAVTVTSTSGASTGASDATSVIAGNLNLLKEQALDPNCNGSGNAWTVAAVSAAPNTCVMYRITVTNVGAANATGVVVSDSTPNFTTLSTLAAPAATTTGPAVGGTGTINGYVGTGASLSPATGGTLAPGQSAQITFGVRINN